MTQHGKSEIQFNEPTTAWTEKTSMEKSRQHLGLETTITEHHQITIPQRLMGELNLHPEDTIRFQWISESEGRVRVLAIISREEERIAVLRILVRLEVKRRLG